MKHIQKIIPVAIEAAQEKMVNKNNKINKEFNGYISSFGASIISAGILPTIVFFNQKGDSSSDRTSIIPAIETILKSQGYIQKDEQLLKRIKELVKNSNQKHQLDFLTEKIMDAVIALKLAIRTFEKTKN